MKKRRVNIKYVRSTEDTSYGMPGHALLRAAGKMGLAVPMSMMSTRVHQLSHEVGFQRFLDARTIEACRKTQKRKQQRRAERARRAAEGKKRMTNLDSVDIDGVDYKVLHVFSDKRVVIDFEGLPVMADYFLGKWDQGAPARGDEIHVLEALGPKADVTDVKVTPPEGQ
jgi:hypothetical protein